MKLNDEIRAVLSSYALPEGVLDKIAGAMARLDRNQVAPGLAVGERAPDFRLPNQAGQEVSLASLLAEGPLVVTFYRGSWCPVCNLQMTALQRALPAIREAGGAVAAISPQTVDHAAAFAGKASLGFDLLADVQQQTIREYRLQFAMPREIKEIHAAVFDVDLRQQNADGSWNLPVPGTFILDRDAIVRARHVSADYTRRMEPDDVVAALKELQTPAGRSLA